MSHVLELVVAFSWDEDGLAIAGLVVAVVGAAVSIPLSIIAHRRAGRAEDASTRAEQRDLERLERERDDVAASRRARLDVNPHVTANRDGRPVARATVRNLGPALANDVRVWLVDRRGLAVSELAGGEMTLDVGQESARLGVLVNEGIAEQDLRLLRWCVEWTDDEEGLHQRITDRRPP